MVQLLWKTVWKFLTKVNILLPYIPALLGIYPKELKTYVTQNPNTDIFSSFIHNYQNLETTKMSFSR